MRLEPSKANGKSKIEPSEERKPWMTALEIRFAEAEPNLGSSRQRLIREILEHAEDTYFHRQSIFRFIVEPVQSAAEGLVKIAQVIGKGENEPKLFRDF